MMRKTGSNLILLILAVCLCVSAVFTGCEKDRNSEKPVVVKDLMLPNSEGTFTGAQVVLPADYQEKKSPVIVLSHGFHGTMNSGGAEELSHILARSGFAVIRMDFSHYVSHNPDSEQTCTYTVDTMTADQVLCVDYVVKYFNGDADRVGVYGRSLGGRAAMKLVNENIGGYDYKALVLVAPAGNEDAFQRYMGGNKKWKQFKRKAEENGSVTYQNVVLTPAFFQSIEDYVPSLHAGSFHNPVLVFYNTEDNVVLPSVSVECAEAYSNHRMVQVTSAESPHGLEMGFRDSEIKDRIFCRIVEFYEKTL